MGQSDTEVIPRESVRQEAARRNVSRMRVQRERAAAGSTAAPTLGRDGKVRPSPWADTTGRDRRIRELLRPDDLTTREIAAQVGCSPDTVSRVSQDWWGYRRCVLGCWHQDTERPAETVRPDDWQQWPLNGWPPRDRSPAGLDDFHPAWRDGDAR